MEKYSLKKWFGLWKLMDSQKFILTIKAKVKYLIFKCNLYFESIKNLINVIFDWKVYIL